MLISLLKGRVVAGTALAVACALAAGCGGGRGGEPADGAPAGMGEGAQAVDGSPSPAAPAGEPAGEPAEGGTLVVGYPADVDLFDPVVAGSDLGAQLLDWMFPLLVVPSFDCRCRYGPGLASSWSFADDGRSITFTLRDDLRWSDGEPVDADDVLFTWSLVADPEVGSPYASYLDALREADPWQRIDRHTVTVHFERAYDRDTMLSHVAGCAVVPEHALRDVPRDQLRGAAFSEAPVTAGGLALERWQRGERLTLARQPGALRPTRLERVEVRVIPEYTTRLLALAAGEIDLLPGLQVEDVERLTAEHPEIRVVRRGRRFVDYVAWNLRDPRFADPRVRTALAHAVDADALIDALLRAGDTRYGARAVGTITPELCDLRDPGLEPLAYDLAAARALLAEAGWRDRDGDGLVEDAAGRPLSFTLETNASNARRVQAQVILQDQLRRAGVDVQLASHEGNVFFERLKHGEFEAALTGWSASLFVDPSRLWRSDGVYNFPGHADAELDRLIDAGLAEPDPVAAASHWRALQARIYEAQPCCFLYWRDELVAVHERFRDVGTDTLSLFDELHLWWVPADARRRPAGR